MIKNCCVTIDLDPVYHYIRSRGWELKPEYHYNTVYEDAIPRYQKLLNKLGVKATFFVVGEDLLDNDNKHVIKELYNDGHEIANHTMNHLVNFGQLTEIEKVDQILKSHELISLATGNGPTGFRAPGWNIDQQTIHILKENNYLYDSSILPSYFNYPLKFYNKVMNWNKNFPVFGKSYRIPFAKRNPYKSLHKDYLKVGNNGIWEVPVSTSPIARFPLIGAMLFKLGAKNFKRLIPKPERLPFFNLILHGLDLVDPSIVDDDRLNMKPGYNLPVEVKEDIIADLISMLSIDYEFTTISNYINVFGKYDS